jgi:hypothetical protein
VEAKSLLAATGCGSCSKPYDPYELGVTKYSGTAIQENGTLDDNFNGAYMFVLPANTEIIPYDNGYYAEFPVNSFSEFWLNNGGVNGDEPLPISLVSFEATKQAGKVLLQWVTSNEINAGLYVVERSADGINYSAIGTVTAYNSTGINNYSLTDGQPLPGLNFYRLKMTDQGGAFKYSPVRKINFNSTANDLTVYPNPVVNSNLFITSSANCTKALLYDAAGKLIKSFPLQGRNNTLHLAGISKGIYQLKIFTGDSVKTEKILIQ